MTEVNALDAATILKKFLLPFEEAEIKLKPVNVKNNRCLALAYIDARLVLDRLDETVGIDGWKDEYRVLEGGTEVECRLSVRIAGEWITKADVGGESEQPDGGDRMKAAYSDALKRAAVKFGIGRFLYRRPQQWMDYDPVAKKIIRPGATGTTRPAPQPAADVLTDSGKEIAAALDNAKSRAEAIPHYTRYDTARKAGHVGPADQAHIEAAVARLNKRHPKPPAPAKA